MGIEGTPLGDAEVYVFGGLIAHDEEWEIGGDGDGNGVGIGGICLSPLLKMEVGTERGRGGWMRIEGGQFLIDVYGTRMMTALYSS